MKDWISIFISLIAVMVSIFSSLYQEKRYKKHIVESKKINLCDQALCIFIQILNSIKEIQQECYNINIGYLEKERRLVIVEQEIKKVIQMTSDFRSVELIYARLEDFKMDIALSCDQTFTGYLEEISYILYEFRKRVSVDSETISDEDLLEQLEKITDELQNAVVDDISMLMRIQKNSYL